MTAAERDARLRLEKSVSGICDTLDLTHDRLEQLSIRYERLVRICGDAAVADAIDVPSWNAAVSLEAIREEAAGEDFETGFAVNGSLTCRTPTMEAHKTENAKLIY